MRGGSFTCSFLFVPVPFSVPSFPTLRIHPSSEPNRTETSSLLISTSDLAGQTRDIKERSDILLYGDFFLIESLTFLVGSTRFRVLCARRRTCVGLWKTGIVLKRLVKQGSKMTTDIVRLFLVTPILIKVITFLLLSL